MIDVIERCLIAKNAGKTPAECASMLHGFGLTIVGTIKAVMETYGLDLASAKSIVSSAPAWRGIVEASEPLHAEAENLFLRPENEARDGGRG
jgi:hypothetical protein